MDSNECPQVTVIPAERGWELVIWQAGGDGEPDPVKAMRSSWLFETAESALLRVIWNESLMPSTPPNPAVWAWDFPSVARSLKVTGGGFG